MSETDDTDELLLIPPDFFLIDSDSDKNYGPYYSVVDSLITQVNHLENRVNYIENSDLSAVSNSIDTSLNLTNDLQITRPFRKFNSAEELYSDRTMTSESTQSTPLKPRSKFKLNSLPSSPQFSRYSPKKNLKSPQKDTHLPIGMHDIDKLRSRKYDNSPVEKVNNFISNVKTIKRLSAVRSLENEFSNASAGNRKVDIDEVDQMLREMDIQKKEIESRIAQKEKEIFQKEPETIKERTWQCGDNINTVPDYDSGMRDLMYPNDNFRKPHMSDNIGLGNNNTQYNTDYSVNINDYETNIRDTSFKPMSSNAPSATTKSNISFDDSLNNEKTSADSSTDSTQQTAYNKYSHPFLKPAPRNSELHDQALSVLNLHKKVLSESSNQNIGPQGKSKKRKDSYNPNFSGTNLSLVSLSDLWGTKIKHDVNPLHSLQKLQEEKLRRQHCEELIQQLQNRTLELQERLVVALQVDEAKDSAIMKFHSAWGDVKETLKNLNQEKLQLEQEIAILNSKHSAEIEEAHQKVLHYENEASKALNLAHAAQEKLSNVEKHFTELENEVHTSQKSYSALQSDYTAEIDKNKQLLEIIAQKEIELNEGKTVLSGARKEVGESRRAVEVCQAEFSAMKTEYNNLEMVLREKENRILELDKQKKKLVNEIDAHKNIEKNLQEELNKTRLQVDNNKVELKNFYQAQVELVVQNKLKEFQSQLDQAESLLKEELKKKEMSIAKTAASHIQQISEKYSLEIKLLEEKHKEEVRLYQIKLSQYQQQIEELEAKFQHQQQKREQIAEQLRRVMEAQWMEALRIISNSRSPMIQQDSAFNTIDQLNSLKSRSYTNLEEVLSHIGDAQTSGQPKRKTARNNTNADSYCSLTEDPPDGNSQSTYRMNEETPVTSRVPSKQQSETELQKYVQMLLDKQPGNPTASSDGQKLSGNSAMERISWQNESQENFNKMGVENKSDHRSRREKRPWK